MNAHGFKALIARLVLLGLTSLSMLVLLEIGTRLISDLPPPMYENDPVLGKIYKANASIRTRVPECDCEVFLRFNRDGLRGEDRPYEKQPGVRRVALVGDSMTAAIATAEEQTAVSVLEDLLNRSGASTAWEVINFGISGSSTGQELVLIRELVWRYQPDLVIGAFFTGNDFADNSRRLTSSGHRIYFDLDEYGELIQLPRSARRSSFATWLNRHSRFYVWQKGAIRSIRSRIKRAGGTLSSSERVYWTRPTDDYAHAWSLLERLIATTKAEVESRGSRFVVAALPSGPQVLDDVWNRLLERSGELRDEMDPYYPERRLQEICRRTGVPLVTMLDEFRTAASQRSGEHPEEWLHFRGSGHFNDDGNRVAAEVLHRFIVETGVLDPEDRHEPSDPALSSAGSSEETSTRRLRASRKAQR